MTELEQLHQRLGELDFLYLSLKQQEQEIEVEKKILFDKIRKIGDSIEEEDVAIVPDIVRNQFFDPTKETVKQYINRYLKIWKMKEISKTDFIDLMKHVLPYFRKVIFQDGRFGRINEHDSVTIQTTSEEIFHWTDSFIIEIMRYLVVMGMLTCKFEFR